MRGFSHHHLPEFSFQTRQTSPKASHEMSDQENAVGLQRLAAEIDRRERQARGPGLVDIRDSREVGARSESAMSGLTLPASRPEIGRHHLLRPVMGAFFSKSMAMTARRA